MRSLAVPLCALALSCSDATPAPTLPRADAATDATPVTDVAVTDVAVTDVSAEDAAVFPPVPAVAERVTESPSEKVVSEFPPGAIARLELLLRDPDGFLTALDRAESSRDANAAMASLTRVLVGAVTVGAGLFGGIVGAHRGGLQVLYCAVKVPLILLVTLVVCAPAFIALARAARLPLGSRSVIALALGSSARFALVLVGLAPFVWLMEGWSLGYHRVILSIVAVCAFAGIAAGKLLFTGLSRSGSAGVRVGMAFVALFGLVGAQTSWILRPYVVRPRTEHPPFVRALEGDLFDSLRHTARSSVVYSGARASECEGSSCD